MKYREICYWTRRRKEGWVMSTILIVEDDVKISRIMELQLKHAGYTTESVYDGASALEKIQENDEIDLVLLDIMLPKLNGLEVCKQIKGMAKDLSVIIVTAKDDITDVITGLDTGADDYITKPFVFEELLARIRANLRKVSNEENDKDPILKIEDLVIHSNFFEVYRNGEKINLSKTEYDLLYYLVLNKSIVVSREQILNKVWGYNYYGNENIVDVYIKYLRDKVDKGCTRKLIQTVRGRGYVIK